MAEMCSEFFNTRIGGVINKLDDVPDVVLIRDSKQQQKMLDLDAELCVAF